VGLFLVRGNGEPSSLVVFTTNFIYDVGISTAS